MVDIFQTPVDIQEILVDSCIGPKVYENAVNSNMYPLSSNRYLLECIRCPQILIDIYQTLADIQEETLVDILQVLICIYQELVGCTRHLTESDAYLRKSTDQILADIYQKLAYASQHLIDPKVYLPDSGRYLLDSATYLPGSGRL